jgi:predicted GIY-YIG superfamily endonuclease
MHYVYLLRSKSHPSERYVGSTNDLKKRLLDHNRGDSPHTARFAPWNLAAYFAFQEKEKALAFERYLKTGSGRAFAKRHFH